MHIIVGILIIVIVSFIWAYISLKRDLKKIDEEKEKARHVRANGHLSSGKETVLFDRGAKKK